MLLEECGAFRLIGEDLGVVPDYVRPCLTRLGIAGFKIPTGKPKRMADDSRPAYPRLSVTTYATHDYQPMKTHWEQRRHEVDSPDEGTRGAAEKELRFLSEFAGLRISDTGWPVYDEHVRHALLEALLASNARFAAFMLTDLFGLEDRFNVPGIASDSNWSARLPMTVREMRGQSPWKEECEWLATAIRRTGRKDWAGR